MSEWALHCRGHQTLSSLIANTRQILITANVELETLSHDDSNSHSISSDGHEFAGPRWLLAPWIRHWPWGECRIRNQITAHNVAISTSRTATTTTTGTLQRCRTFPPGHIPPDTSSPDNSPYGRFDSRSRQFSSQGEMSYAGRNGWGRP